MSWQDAPEVGGSWADAPEVTPEKPKKSAAYERGRNLPGALQGLASVAQGPTFGFADELGGVLGGALSALRGRGYQPGYESARDMMRGAADQQAAENPMTTMITRGMASAPTFLLNPFGGAFSGSTMASRAGNAAATGGAFGAVSGAGSSTAEDASGVLLDAGKGAALGASTSAASVPAAAILGAGARNVGGRFSEHMASRYAKEKVAEALIRDARGAAAQSGMTAPLLQAARQFDRLGPEARVVDAGGQNTRQLLDTLAILPGRAKEATEAAIRSRQAGRADRLIGAADKGLGSGGKRVQTAVDDWVVQRQQAASPLYERLHKTDLTPDAELAALVKATEDLGAAKVGKEIATANLAPYTLNSASKGVWSMRDLDYSKQGLDTLIAKSYGQDGRLTPKGFALSKLKDAYTAKLDDMTGGAYATARDAFAGPSALIDAANAGRRILSQSDDLAVQKVKHGMSASEGQAFQLGAFEALRAKLGTPGGQTEVLGMWKNKTLRDKLQAIFPDERAFRQFAATAAKEARLKGLESVGRGSQTAGRHFAAGDLDVSAIGDIGGMAGGAAHGNLPQFLLSAANAWNRVKTPEPVRDAMSGLLLQRGPQGLAGLLDLEDTMRAVNASRSRAAAGMGAVSGGLLAPSILH